MATNLHRLSQQEAADVAANPIIRSKVVQFDGTTNNGKISTAALLSTSLTGTNNDLDITAATAGSAGNSITVAYVDPAAQGASLSVSVSGTDITVSLATDSVATAQGTLTSDATAPSNNDTVTIGQYVYTYKTTLTGAPFEVLIGASAAVALDNLKSAVNGTSGEGTTYGTGTVPHPRVDATTNTDTTQLFVSKVAGSAFNSIATTEASTHLSWGAATLTGGLDGGAITSTAAQVDAAIDAHAPAAALVTPANKAGNDGTGIVTAMARTNLSGGSDGYVDLFVLEEDYNIAVYGTCQVDLVGASATISVGYTGQTTVFVPSTTATTLDVGESIDKTGVLAEGALPDATPFRFVQKGTVIRVYVGTATITAGTVSFYIVAARPLGTTAAVTATSTGNVAAGATDSGNPVKVGGVYNSTMPTYTNGQRGNLEITTRGSTKTTLFVNDSATAIAALATNADAQAESSIASHLEVISRASSYNGTTFDRVRNNFDSTLLASAARTATIGSPDQTNFNGRGVLFTLNVTVEAAAETLSLKIQAKDPVSGAYADYIDFGVIYNAASAAPGAFIAVAYPGLIAADLVSGAIGKSAALPRVWRAVVTHSASGSWTYSLAASTVL